MRSYLELIEIPTFEERFEYLKIGGRIGVITFGGDRYLNQIFYTSDAWRSFRTKVISRDKGCDLGINGRDIFDQIIVHHINPITVEDVVNRRPCLFDMNNVICVSGNTHRAIHYGDKNLLLLDPVVRRPNDTCPWKRCS